MANRLISQKDGELTVRVGGIEIPLDRFVPDVLKMSGSDSETEGGTADFSAATRIRNRSRPSKIATEECCCCARARRLECKDEETEKKKSEDKPNEKIYQSLIQMAMVTSALFWTQAGDAALTKFYPSDDSDPGVMTRVALAAFATVVSFIFIRFVYVSRKGIRLARRVIVNSPLNTEKRAQNDFKIIPNQNGTPL
jgi:hypothetical protein